MKSFLHNYTFRVFIVTLTAMTPLAAAYEQSGAGSPTAKINSNLPVLVVQTVTVAPKVDWPYVPSKVQAQMIAILQARVGKKFDIVSTVPNGSRKVYLLEIEIIAWNAGAVFSPFGSRRESATVRYWVIGPHSKKVFEQTDVIREPYIRAIGSESAGAPIVGHLADSLANKIALRLKSAKLS